MLAAMFYIIKFNSQSKNGICYKKNNNKYNNKLFIFIIISFIKGKKRSI